MAAIVTALPSFADMQTGKKYLSFGWEYRGLSPQDILSNADKFAATGIDGIGIYLRATNSVGKELMFVSRCDKWEREAFLPQIPVLRRIARTPHLSESFFVGYGAPSKRLAWTDDAAWENMANSMAVLGWLTSQTGIKGLWCDLEDYSRQWQYNRLETDPAYNELLPLVRKRGAQVFGALFRENPDIRLLFCWILCFNTEYLTSPNPAAMARQNGDLEPAFVDGILDVMPETARLINGDEHTYRAMSVNHDFHRSYANQRTICPKLVSPENRAKFLRLTQTAFAFYYDAYVCDEKSTWYIPPAGGSRAERLRRNLFDATRLADEYVWFWGELHPTIHWENVTIAKRVSCPDTWEEAIPGVTEAQLCCKSDDWGMKRRINELRRQGKLVDCNTNSSCVSDAANDKIPKPYGCWQPSKSKGRVFLDRTTGYRDSTSIAFENCQDISCVLYGVSNVTPGDVYLMTAFVKGHGKIVISFMKDGKWARMLPDVTLAQGEPDDNGWRKARGIVVVPPNADSFSMKMYANGAGSNGSARFDDIHVYRLW